MKSAVFAILTICCSYYLLEAQSGRVGIGTTNPLARLHVQDSSVLFSGSFDDVSPSPLPIEGAGTRMLWYPDKAAFRAGSVTGIQWDQAYIGPYSVAMGFNSAAFGPASFASGYSAYAQGNSAIALGYNTNAYGN